MLAVERRLPLPVEKEYSSLPQLSTKSALFIGICQVMAFVPGVSRSGASIVVGYSPVSIGEKLRGSPFSWPSRRLPGRRLIPRG